LRVGNKIQRSIAAVPAGPAKISISLGHWAEAIFVCILKGVADADPHASGFDSILEWQIYLSLEGWNHPWPEAGVKSCFPKSKESR